MFLPAPRGPISSAVVAALSRQDVSRLPDPSTIAEQLTDPILDEDLQLSLWTCYELHYRGFDDSDPTWEWQPELIAVRRTLETRLLRGLRAAVTVPRSDRPVAERLRALVDGDDGPSVSRYVQRDATAEQFLEFVMLRSVYQLKEADPHTWAIPRLLGRAKAALVEIQIDEYGGGDLARMHSELYRKLLRNVGLDETYGAYVEVVPAVGLAISNVMSLFGLRRELRGALVGHLAAYEMTSSDPCRRYAKGLRRLGGSDAACEFYDEHVTADALHEQLAANDLGNALAEDEPELTEDILFGAATSIHIDTCFAEYVLPRWQRGESALYCVPTLVSPSAG